MNKGLLFEIQYDEDYEEGVDTENTEIKNNSEPNSLKEKSESDEVTFFGVKMSGFSPKFTVREDDGVREVLDITTDSTTNTFSNIPKKI